MHPRMQEVVDFVDEQYAAFRATADAVPAADRERQPAEGCWSVAQVVDHVGRVEGVCAQLVTGMVAEARARGVGEETETGSAMSQTVLAKTGNRSHKLQSPEGARPAPDARYEDAMAALERAHHAVREALASGAGLALGTISMPHPALGVLNVYEWGVAVGGHTARHAAQIRETAAALAAAPTHGAAAD
jgi:DinB superfamily